MTMFWLEHFDLWVMDSDFLWRTKSTQKNKVKLSEQYKEEIKWVIRRQAFSKAISKTE